jgi:pimeloyl-ACP methyl ester carboxylesterase
MIRFSALAALCLALAGELQAQAKPASVAPIVFPDTFDSIGTPVQMLIGDKGREIHFTDTGEAGWRTMLFIGGVGTSARAPELVAFLDSMRRRLKVRIVAVERNGLGDTAFDPDWGFADYGSDVRRVLGHLGVDRFALVAISGGGAYAGHIAAAMPERLYSWHMLAAVSSIPSGAPTCALDNEVLRAQLAPQVAAPRVWWDMPKDGVSAKVRGFADRTADEGARAFFIAGQKGDARGVAREYRRFCDPPADVSRLTAPAFFYYGEADKVVTPAQGEFWAGKVKGKVTFRRYPGEGHDVQYRHWDQLLLDVAGFGDRVLVCDRGRARLVAGSVDPQRLPAGQTLGVCAWQKPA